MGATNGSDNLCVKTRNVFYAPHTRSQMELFRSNQSKFNELRVNDQLDEQLRYIIRLLL